MISTLLKKVMAECKLKQADLAEVLGVPLDRVKALTSGRVKNLTREESEVLIDVLKIRASWLISGEGPMFQSDHETEDEFMARRQRISRMVELVNAMPLREFTRIRLCGLMKGDVAQDGLYIANAIRNEALGIDFVTGKPIDASPAPAPTKVKQQAKGPGSSIQVGGSISGSTVFNGEMDGDSAAADGKRATRAGGPGRKRG